MSEFHISENLRRLRTFYEYRQEDISKQLHISRQAYSKYERGKSLPDLETTLRIANFYHITLEQLLLAQDPANPSFSGTASTQYALVPMNGPDSKMYRYYRGLSEIDQRDIRDYVEYRRLHPIKH